MVDWINLTHNKVIYFNQLAWSNRLVLGSILAYSPKTVSTNIKELLSDPLSSIRHSVYMYIILLLILVQFFSV
jgi:hypothetical protein